MYAKEKILTVLFCGCYRKWAHAFGHCHQNCFPPTTLSNFHANDNAVFSCVKAYFPITRSLSLKLNINIFQIKIHHLESPFPGISLKGVFVAKGALPKVPKHGGDKLVVLWPTVALTIYTLFPEQSTWFCKKCVGFCKAVTGW